MPFVCRMLPYEVGKISFLPGEAVKEKNLSSLIFVSTETKEKSLDPAIIVARIPE